MPADAGHTLGSEEDAFGSPKKHPPSSMCLSLVTACSHIWDLTARGVPLGLLWKFSFILILTRGGLGRRDPERLGPVPDPLLLARVLGQIKPPPWERNQWFTETVATEPFSC